MTDFFNRIASASARALGSPIAFTLSVLGTILWAISGPLFKYSDTWQLVINTCTTVLTFLAVFLIQNSQNRDGAAIQAKLDELIKANKAASNDLIQIEKKPVKEIERERQAKQD